MNDCICMNIIKLVKGRILQDNQAFEQFDIGALGITDAIVCYSVVPMSKNSGIIEFVDECKPLKDFESGDGRILRYLISNNQGKYPPVNTLIYSSAIFTVLTYFLGVGDRHSDNILITTKGKFFHIDFGFILGSDPKSGFISVSAVRLSPVILEACLQTEGEHTKERYSEFFNVCLNLYSIIRYYYSIFFHLLNTLSDSYPEKEIVQQLSQRFFIEFSDEEARHFFSTCLDTSINNLSDTIRNLLHDKAHLLAVPANFFKYWLPK